MELEDKADFFIPQLGKMGGILTSHQVPIHPKLTFVVRIHRRKDVQEG